MSKQYEQRSSTEKLTVEERQEGSDKLTINGYAAVFNSLSHDLGGFRERIDPAAFNEVLENDVRAAFNHDPSMILGRTSAGTLRLSIDDTGLRYEVDLPNSTMGRDLYESVQRGDIAESSFKFTVLDDEWRDTEEGVIRTIKQVGRLIDVAPVSFPAYPDATVAARSLEQWKETVITDDDEKRLQLLRVDLESRI